MSSEAITQNDLREILSRTVGSIPSEYKKLLWSNPNPTANFPTQALLNGEDLTVYDAIEVIGINYSGYKSIMPPLQIPIGGKGNLIGLAGSTGDSSGTGYLVMRGISANSNSIVVSGAMGVATNGTSWGANDNNMIPQKIYGIKYERVNPPQISGWDYITSVTGSNTATFTDLATQGYSEVFVRDNTYSGGYAPVVALPTILTWGGFYSGINGLLHGVDITTTSIKGRYGMTDSTNYLATTTFSLYAR